MVVQLESCAASNVMQVACAKNIRCLAQACKPWALRDRTKAQIEKKAVYIPL